jgi:hypothetical protein
MKLSRGVKSPLSPFMMTQMREPTHLSMSSGGVGASVFFEVEFNEFMGMGRYSYRYVCALPSGRS